jgi:hypothetical protein
MDRDLVIFALGMVVIALLGVGVIAATPPREYNVVCYSGNIVVAEYDHVTDLHARGSHTWFYDKLGVYHDITLGCVSMELFNE